MPKEQGITTQERVSLADFLSDVRGSFLEFVHMRERRAPLESVNSKNRELAGRIVAFVEQKRDAYLDTGRSGDQDDTSALIDGEAVSVLCEFGYNSVSVNDRDGRAARATIVNGSISPRLILINNPLIVTMHSRSVDLQLQIKQGEDGYSIKRMSFKDDDESSPIVDERKLVFRSL